MRLGFSLFLSIFFFFFPFPSLSIPRRRRRSRSIGVSVLLSTSRSPFFFCFFLCLREFSYSALFPLQSDVSWLQLLLFSLLSSLLSSSLSLLLSLFALQVSREETGGKGVAGEGGRDDRKRKKKVKNEIQLNIRTLKTNI